MIEMIEEDWAYLSYCSSQPAYHISLRNVAIPSLLLVQGHGGMPTLLLRADISPTT